MFKFFESISNLIGIIVNFVVSAFKMTMMIITQIPQAIAFVVTSVAYLPPFLVTFVLLFVATVVIINLINKGS
ncbi:MAG: hypothetical protein HFG54_15090 [Lachnospiraceae bacterium]|jgi:hypothetical protein|nr:hypothetical protein [Lachnospiraceae bacterium]